MSRINSAVLNGKISQKYSQTKQVGDSSVTTFSVYVPRLKKGGDFQNKDDYEMDYYSCEAWGRTSEQVQKIPDKAEVTIHGRLKTDSWNDKQTGKKVTKVKISVDQIHAPSGADKPGIVQAAGQIFSD